MILFVGFAALCTAGILYPLQWIMGIRLAKEDELEGLDLAGITFVRK
jgi:ammonia channel protein AmtB